jgi:hypothetical protein
MGLLMTYVDNGLIYWSGFDGINLTWTNPQYVENAFTSSSPVLTPGYGAFYMAWKGADADQRLFVSTSTDGTNWSTPQTIPGNSSDGPALGSSYSNGILTLYLAWKGEMGDQRLFWTMSLDGNVWEGQRNIVGIGFSTSTSPAITAW